ncbi:bifunctional diaminohydroxyphosphoribosylaminopyrimidine deaminase/5-amino-6-(5-phosphoribosylamino)uracil reductase RibD [Persephonella sp.]
MDKLFMEKALELARMGKGLTHPNPTVGAVIVKDGRIIGLGYHKKAGKPHAEIEAIKDAVNKGFKVEGSTMYVTLEPCCHYGKTPPCTDAIITNKIKKVVVATLDPNPQVSGKGIKKLKEKGIETVVGLLEKDAVKINEDFFTYVTKKRPFIHLKTAQTIDGKIATKTGSSKWITSEEGRKFAHRLRYESSCVLVGSNTVLKDNPQLTVRYFNVEKQPKRVILDTDLKIPLNYKIFDRSAETIVFTRENGDKEKIKKLKDLGIEVIQVPLKEHKLNLKNIIEEIYKRDLIHILVEGGSSVTSSFLREGLYDKLSVFIAPKIIGEDGLPSIKSLGIRSIDESLVLKIESLKKIGSDVYLELYP